MRSIRPGVLMAAALSASVANSGSTILCKNDEYGRPDYSWRKGKADGSDARCAPGLTLSGTGPGQIAGCGPDGSATGKRGVDGVGYGTADWSQNPVCAPGYRLQEIPDPEPTAGRASGATSLKRKLKRRYGAVHPGIRYEK